MNPDILNSITGRKYPEAYELVKQKQLPKIYTIWTLVYDGRKYEEIERKINVSDFENETKEAVKLYIALSESGWDTDLLAEFRKVSKMMIAEAASELRDASYEIVNGQITPTHNFNTINPDLRNSLQEWIEYFDKKELYESKADVARVKAQLTLTLNLDKTLVGADMIQYAKFYENVKQFDDSIQIYNGVICDFEAAITETYEDKKKQLLELGFLKEAYEGNFRLTKNPEMQQKLKTLHAVQSQLQSGSLPDDKSKSVTGEKKSWFKKIFNS